MKTLVLVLVLAMMLMSGSALQCNYCVPVKDHRCRMTSEICQGEKDTCASVIYTDNPMKHFRKCMTKKDCRVYDETPNVHAVCCQWNNCN
ncbi:CD59 glycoprotein-like [Silurus meridionalis]|nr:CD59 glycoprotein-like [Silurus meridionalis]